MSQGSNYKKEVMEALFNAPTNTIKNKAIMWAASNLPDEGGQGVYQKYDSLVFDHNKNSFWEAVGFSEERVDKATDSLKEQLHVYADKNKDNDKHRKSEIFEHLLTNCSKDAIFYLTVKGYMELHESLCRADSEATDSIIDLLKNLRRKLGGEE